MAQCGFTYSHVVRVGLWADLADQWSSRGLRPLLDGFLVKLLREGVLALIEGLVKDNGWLDGTLCLGESDIRSSTEEVRVTVRLGDLVEGSVGLLVIGGEVANNDNLVGGLELIESGRGGELRHSR